MKGILIGIFYIIRYGIGGLFALIQKLLCTHLHSAISCNRIVSYAVLTVITLVSGIVYSIVAWKYRLRERDEVVNVYIFAEEYYGTREDDSNSYSDIMDQECMIVADLTCSYVHWTPKFNNYNNTIMSMT